MDFDLSEEQRLLKESLDRLIGDRYAFEQRKSYAQAPEGWSRELWAQYAELGLLGLPFAERYGGSGGGPVETMIAMGATNLPERAMRQQIASAIQIVVQQTRLSDGSRKVTSVAEITGMEGDIITMQEIFTFEKVGLTQEGKVVGRFRATGVRPKVCERLKACGIHLPGDMFEGVTEVR